MRRNQPRKNQLYPRFSPSVASPHRAPSASARRRTARPPAPCPRPPKLGPRALAGVRSARRIVRRRAAKLYEGASTMVTRAPRPVLLLALAFVVALMTASAAVTGALSAGVLRRRAAFLRPAGLLASGANATAVFGGVSSGGGYARPQLLRARPQLLRAVFSAAEAVFRPWWVRALACVYATAFVLLICSHRAQTWIIYLHWLRPPLFVSAPANVRRFGISGFTRPVEAGHLQGWHMLPTGPPFAQSPADYDKRLLQPDARVVIFFHGNSGTRAFPPKRIRQLYLLAAHFRAHVFSFDYSGFADSGGRPSESQFYADARVVYAFVRARVSPSAKIIIYGQSLGTFAAVDLAAFLSESHENSESALDGGSPVASVIIEAPPASLVDAAKSHPSAAPFRIIPGIDAIFRNVLKERLDSLSKVGRIKFPLLVMHGREDGFISLSQGVKLFEQAKAGGNRNVRMVVFPNCGHIDVATQNNYLNTLHDFLEEHAPQT